MKSQVTRNLFALSVAGFIAVSSAGMALAAGKADTVKKGEWAEKKQALTEEFYTRISASPEQKQQLNSLHEKYDPQMKSLQKSMWQQKKDLMTYIFSPDATQTEANRRQEQLEESKEQLGQLELQAAFEKKAILSPEQQKKAVVFFNEKAEKTEKMIEEKTRQ